MQTDHEAAKERLNLINLIMCRKKNPLKLNLA